MLPPAFPQSHLLGDQHWSLFISRAVSLHHDPPVRMALELLPFPSPTPFIQSCKEGGLFLRRVLPRLTL